MRDFTVRLVEVAGMRGRVFEAGSGPAVVILVSPLVLGWAYVPTIRAMCQSFRVMAVEMPGCGRGSEVVSPWSVDDYAKWLEAFVQSERLEGSVVVGHSNSGVIAQQLGVRAPGLVERVVLVDSIGADLEFSMPRTVAGRAWDAVLEWRLTLRGFWQLPYNMLFHWRNFWEQVRWSSWMDAREVAKALKVRTVLAWGRRDHTVPLRCMEVYGSLIEKREMVISEIGSHDWLITHAQEFAELAVTKQPGHFQRTL